MFKSAQLLLLSSIILLSSCSIFRSNTASKLEIEVIDEIPEVVEVVEKPTVDVATADVDETPSKELDVPKEEVVQRATIGPFTAEQSASVVIPEFKNNPTLEDIEIDLSELGDQFHFPVDGELSSPYGWRRGRMHSGVDIRAPRGNNIYAAFDGVVRFAKYNGAYGNCIVIRHYNGLETMYAHATKLLVKVNDEVRAGDIIAFVGRTGRATGDHLHFEVRAAGQCFNPTTILDLDSKTAVDKKLYVTMREGRVFASNSDDSTTRDEEIKEITSIKYHIVRSGDTLSRIAANNRTTVTSLCKMNNISSTSILSIGQRVRVQ